VRTDSQGGSCTGNPGNGMRLGWAREHIRIKLRHRQICNTVGKELRQARQRKKSSLHVCTRAENPGQRNGSTSAAHIIFCQSSVLSNASHLSNVRTTAPVGASVPAPQQKNLPAVTRYNPPPRFPSTGTWRQHSAHLSLSRRALRKERALNSMKASAAALGSLIAPCILLANLLLLHTKHAQHGSASKCRRILTLPRGGPHGGEDGRNTMEMLVYSAQMSHASWGICVPKHCY
jgi:hypothetical protein